MFPHKRLNLTWMKTQTMKWIYPQHFVNTCIQNRNWTNKAIFTIGSVASNWACALLYCYKYGPDPDALAASQLQNKVQAVLLRPRQPLQSQPCVPDGNSPVSRHQQIKFQSKLIFYLINGLFSTTAAHEVRRAGVLTCGSCHLECSARPHPHCAWSCQVPKTAEITLF